MKKIVVDCSKPLGEQEVVIDIPDDEAAALLAMPPAEPPQASNEDRIAQLEAQIAVLLAQSPQPEQED